MSLDPERLQAALEQTGEAHGPGLFGVITEHGEEIFRGATGTASLSGARAIRIDDRLRIGSITKTFVTVLALQLIADDVMTWQDTVEHWLPGLIPDGKDITVGHLLRMQSGLPDYTEQLLRSPPALPDLAQLQRYWSPEQLVAAALVSDDRLAPDSGFRYCNTDYIVLGLVIEHATGQRVDAQLWQRVLQPAGLVDTTFPIADLQLAHPHAEGHLRLGPDQPYVECTTMTPSEGWTAGGMVSTPRDLATFMSAVFDGTLLDAGSLQRMTACEVPVHATRWRGLGIDRRLLPGGMTVLGHHGGVPGFTSMVVRTPGDRVVVLYQNGIDIHDCLSFDAPFIVAGAAG